MRLLKKRIREFNAVRRPNEFPCLYCIYNIFARAGCNVFVETYRALFCVQIYLLFERNECIEDNYFPQTNQRPIVYENYCMEYQLITLFFLNELRHFFYRCGIKKELKTL